MVKKAITCLVALMALMSIISCPLQASATQVISVYLDGKRMKFEAAPQLVNGTTMVPMRTIFESLGADVKWDGNTKSITATKDEMKIKLTIGKRNASMNGQSFNISVAPAIIKNTTYVPLRFVSESLGANVGWIKQSNTVTISSEDLYGFQVEHIRDGDTFKGTYIDGPRKGQEHVIRLIGVDTPETVKEGIAVQYWGPEASNYTKQQLSGQTVYIAEDKTEDPYGRTLAYVYMQNGALFNADLVARGYARALPIEPNTKWKDLFSYLEVDAKTSKRGLWSQPSTQPFSYTNELNKYLEEKAAEYGFINGEFHPEVLITEQQLLKYLLIALFPETKAIFLAKTFYDLSQEEQLQKIVAHAFEFGLITKNEISDTNEPLTHQSAITIISKALQLEKIEQSYSLSDFGIYLDQSNTDSTLTWGDAILLLEKTKNVYEPLMEYFSHMTDAVKHSETVEVLSATLVDQQIAEKFQSYASNVKSTLTNPELIGSIKDTGTNLLTNLKSLITGWKDVINITKINDAIQSAIDSITEAENALELAQSAN